MSKMSRYILTILCILSTYGLTAQVYNPIPQYVFKNKLGIGRSTHVDTSAYLNIGPNGGANAGVLLPRIADTLSILGTKRNGLLIYSNQLSRFAYWDSTNARWSEIGTGSSPSSDDGVVLSNATSSAGFDTLLVVVDDTTAMFKSLYQGNGIIIEKMGDTALKLNIDSTYIFGGDTANLIIQNAGTGQQTWFDRNDTLFMKRVNNSFSLSWATSSDSSLSVSLDTALMATRARVQKGIDSVSALISSGGGGTVTSVSAGTGMSFTTITNAGSVSVDTTKMITVDRLYKVVDSLPTGGGGSPGGSSGAIQFNNSGSFGGSDSLYWDNSNERLGIGTNSSLVASLNIKHEELGTAQTENDGILLENTTAAASGLQQRSPAIRFSSHGWKTATTAASMPVEWRIFSLPVQGTSTPSYSLVFETQVNNSTRFNSYIFDVNGLRINPSGGAGGISFTGSAPVANQINGSTGLIFTTGSTPTAGGAFDFSTSAGFQQTSGETRAVRIQNGTSGTGFFPTSGTATHSIVDIGGFIRQTGTASGISRSLYISTITAGAADYRAIQVDSGRTFLAGLVTANRDGDASGDFTVTDDDYTVELQDLSANRNVVLPAATQRGRILVVVNLSSDATFKWSFSGATVNDAAGTAVTTLTDQKTYTLISNGSLWRVVSVY